MGVQVIAIAADAGEPQAAEPATEQLNTMVLPNFGEPKDDEELVAFVSGSGAGYIT